VPYLWALQDPSGPVFTNWSVVSLNHSVPRPVEFLSFESLTGAVSGPGVQMRLAAQGLAEAGFEAGYEASMVVNVSQAGGLAHSDVPVGVTVEVCIYIYSVKSSIGHTHTHTTAEQTTHTHTNTERATAQRRLIVEVVVAAPKLPPSAALLLSSLLPTRGTGLLPERTTRTGTVCVCVDR